MAKTRGKILRDTATVSVYLRSATTAPVTGGRGRGPPGARRPRLAGSSRTHLLAVRAGRRLPRAAGVAGGVVDEAVGTAHGAVVLGATGARAVAGGRQLQVAFGQGAAGGRQGGGLGAGPGVRGGVPPQDSGRRPRGLQPRKALPTRGVAGNAPATRATPRSAPAPGRGRPAPP